MNWTTIKTNHSAKKKKIKNKKPSYRMLPTIYKSVLISIAIQYYSITILMRLFLKRKLIVSVEKIFQHRKLREDLIVLPFIQSRWKQMHYRRYIYVKSNLYISRSSKN